MSNVAGSGRFAMIEWDRQGSHKEKLYISENRGLGGLPRIEPVHASIVEGWR